MQFVQNIKEKIKKYKWILLGIVLSVLLALATVFGVRYYQFRQSPEYAFGTFQAALSSANIEQLAHLVDFRTIAQHLAEETAKTFPFFLAGPDQQGKISNFFQAQMLKILRQKPESNDDGLINDPVVLLQKPVYLLPPDIIPQLVRNMALRNVDANSQMITTHFDHPLFKRSFPVVLGLTKSSEGWIIRDYLNAQETLTTFRTIFEERLRAQLDLLKRKSQKVIQEMHKTMEIQSCACQAGLISDKRTLLIVVHLLARNKTGLTVKNVNATTQITNAKGELLLERQLNAVDPTGPSEDFSHRWTIELDGTSDEGKRILAAGPLSCSATWRTLSLSNARVFHADPQPDELKHCTKHEDGHPEGLCDMEIFKFSSPQPAAKEKEKH
ncbi:MAG: translation initiation factor IF-2 [Desulfovibrio sp.]|nr:translation initiation factor IF-2 [Desulfovibrio sp.]